MSKLYDVILSHARAEAQAGDYAAAKTKLENKSIVNRNNKLHVLGDLIRLLGVEQASLVAATIQAVAASNPIVAGAWIALNTTGLQLADDDRQLILDQLGAAGNWPAETLKKVKNLVKQKEHRLKLMDLRFQRSKKSKKLGHSIFLSKNISLANNKLML
jgi:hypothetical protein